MMRKLVVALRHGAVRAVPALVAGALAVAASPSFRGYVDAHPQFAAVVPVIVAILHALAKARTA